MKKIIYLVMALVLSLSLVACSGSAPAATTTAQISDASSASSDTTSSEPAKKLLVGCVVKFQHPFFTALMNGAKDAAAELGYDIEAMAPTAANDAMSQVQMVEDLVARGVDILLLSPSQPDTLVNVLTEAVNKGITIVCVDADMGDAFPARKSYVGTGHRAAFITVANELSKLLEKGSNVVVIRGPLGDFTHEERSAGAVQGLEDNGMNVLEVFDAGSVADKAAAAAEDFMLKYKDTGIDAFLCCDDEMAVGVATAVKQAGKSGEILVSGFDGNQAAVEMVGTGEIAFDLAQNPYEMGYQGMMIADQAYKGESVEEFVDTGVIKIDKSNYMEYLE